MKLSNKNVVVVTAIVALSSCLAWAAEPTAFDLIKKGNDYVGVQSKDKVLEIHSDKSVAGLTPRIWYVLYYDPDTTFNAVEVKFGAGEKMDLGHPFRPINPVHNYQPTLDKAKLKIDSDQALSIATNQPLLKNLTLRASQIWLEPETGGPTWKVKLWAAKLRKPADDTSVGEVYISAEDGKVTKSTLHPDSVD